MRVVYFGSGAFGVPTLRAVRKHHEVLAVVTQPDRAAGRGKKLTPTPIAEEVDRQPLASGDRPSPDVLKPEDVNEGSVVERVRAFDADAWVVIAFGQKLGRELLADRFALNLHASLLPRWRGAAPINHAILAGDAHTGNSVITLADRMDAGLILGQSERAIEPHLTAGELHDLLSADGPELVLRVLDEHAQHRLKPREQDAALVTKAPKLSKADAWIDFTETAEACRRRVHGLSPWPGVLVAFRGEPVKLGRVQALEHSEHAEAGTILDAKLGLVACRGPAALRVLELQPAGKRMMDWSAFANGAKPRSGERLAGREPE